MNLNVPAKSSDESQRKTDINHVAQLYNRYRLFFKFVWPVLSPEPPVWNWHIDAISSKLQELSSYIIDRKPSPYDLIINVPPGMTKSSLVTQAFPMWLWLHDPTICIITSSYSEGLAIDNSLKARTILEHDRFLWFQEFVFKRQHKQPLMLIKDTERYWINNFGGWYYATSTGGTVTGKHAHLIIRDDPLNPQQADSEAHRIRCNRFNDNTLATRKKDKEVTPTITVMQRLHEDDPTGHDLRKEGKKIYHICLPAEDSEDVKPAQWRVYYKDGLLDPVRLNSEILRIEKSGMGSYAYAGQYGQKTTPEAGGKIQRDWFETCKPSQVPDYVVPDLWIDGAYTKVRRNDPTGLMVAGYDNKNNQLFIFHASDGYMEMPELLRFINEYCQAHNVKENVSRIWIEPKATGLTLKQLLNAETNYNAVDIRSHLVAEGKEARIQAAAPKIQSGRITLVDGAWMDHFVSQLTVFPNGLHDEFVDLIGYAVDHYFPKHQTVDNYTKEEYGFY